MADPGDDRHVVLSEAEARYLRALAYVDVARNERDRSGAWVRWRPVAESALAKLRAAVLGEPGDA